MSERLSSPSQPRILVIDDDEELAEVMETLLMREGWSVLYASDGVRGIETAREELPDVIICDIHMPGANGFRVAQELKNYAPTALTPFIFLTGETKEVARRHGMNLGADDYLTKPFEADDLIAAVRMRLEKRRIFEREKQRIAHAIEENLSQALPHEFRTPLNGILGFTELLRQPETRRMMTDAEIDEMLGYIEVSGKRLQQLVERFLLYFRLFNSPVNLTRPMPVPVDLVAVIESAVEQVNKVWSRGEDFKLELEPATVLGVSTDLEVVLAEVLDNACKFSAVHNPIHLIGKRASGGYRLHVLDEGVGMSAEEIARIAPFAQFKSRGKAQDGLGIGLTIVRRLMEESGGSLVISSRGDKGLEVALVWKSILSQ